MAEYNYDENGVYFSFFLASILTLLLFPWTYKFFSSSESFFSSSSCHCSPCLNKYNALKRREYNARRTARLITGAILFLSWIVYVFQIHRVFTTVIAVPNLFDPWAVLGVERSANKSVIKKVYYELSRTNHPDKVPQSQKLAANEKFALIARAYSTLSNDEARKRYEDWGNPDGRQSITMGIALPLWLVNSKSSPFVILGYCLIFGILLPWSISKWWYHNRRYTREKILFDTMTVFFRGLSQTSDMQSILMLICKAHEWAENFPFVQEVDEKPMKILETQLLKTQSQLVKSGIDLIPNEISSDNQAKKIWILLISHFYRIFDVVEKQCVDDFDEEEAELLLLKQTSKNLQCDKKNSISKKKKAALQKLTMKEFERLCDEKNDVVITAFRLLKGGITEITVAHDWLYQTIMTLDLSQQLVQAMFQSMPVFLQMPHLDLTLIEKYFSKTLKPINMIEDLSQLLTKHERAKMFHDLLPKQIDDIELFLDSFPRLVIDKLCFRVIGEKSISPGSLVTCFVGLKIVPSSSKEKIFSFIDEENDSNLSGGCEKQTEDENVLQFESEGDGSGGRKLKIKKRIPAAHAPLFTLEKRPSWWVLLGVPNGNRIVAAEHVTDLEASRTVLLRFEAPQSIGQYQFRIYVLGDHFVGTDIKVDRTMDVVDRTNIEIIEDDISEPDEDTIAGQMAIIRGHGIGKNAKQKNIAASKSISNEKSLLNKSKGHENSNSDDSSSSEDD